MLDIVEETLKLNKIKYNRTEGLVDFKFGGLSSKVRIKYNPSDNDCSLESGETALVISTFLVTLAASLILMSASGFLGLVSVSLLVFAALINVLTILVTQIKLLDIKSQLRSSGIYL